MDQLQLKKRKREKISGNQDNNINNMNNHFHNSTNKIVNKNKKKIIAVIPAHNESKYIKDVVKKAKQHVDVVIVVDDASTDDTKELAEEAGAIVLRHAINLMKGASLKTGCELALQKGADIIITLDADGQHDPNEIPKFIEKLNQSDLVIGIREFDKNMSLKSKIGNKILSGFSKVLYRTDIKDSQSGFRAFNTNIYKKIAWESSDYGVETEMIKRLSDNHIKFSEVKIKTIYNDKYKGTTPIDGIKIAFNMIKWRMKAKA